MGKKITTFEGFSQTEEFADYINALRKEQVRLCDFCQPGKMLTLHSVLETMEEFDSSVILKAMNSHKCRCTTYSSLLKAAKRIYNTKRRRQRAVQ
jgi:aerobic-type carbon monoxide dehydrogenase small subunit (CoxS/CutS family)